MKYKKKDIYHAMLHYHTITCFSILLSVFHAAKFMQCQWSYKPVSRKKYRLKVPVNRRNDYEMQI